MLISVGCCVAVNFFQCQNKLVLVKNCPFDLRTKHEPSSQLFLSLLLFPCRWMHNDLQVGLVGTKVDLTYTYEVNLSCLCIFNIKQRETKLTVSLGNNLKVICCCYFVRLFSFQHLGDSASVLKEIVSGNHAFSKVSVITLRLHYRIQITFTSLGSAFAPN